MKPIKFIAHRGGAALAPENTLAAFKNSGDLGIAWIELDCRLSKDNEVIVIHDETVDRTTNSSGPVQEMTLNQLKELDAGAWFSPDFKDESIPSMFEVLQFAKKNDLKIYLEIKPQESLIIPILLQLINKTQMQKSVTLQSYHFKQLQLIKAKEPTWTVEYIVDHIEPCHIEKALLIQARAINPDHQYLKNEDIKKVQESNLEINIFTVNDSKLMGRFITLGVDGIITDYPDKTLSLNQLF